MPIGLGDEQLWLCPSLDNVTPFNDLSSQGNNGTAVGGLATIADSGAGGNLAYNIDTTSKYVDCGNILDAPAQFSISAWVNRGTRADVTGIAGKWNGSGYMLYNSTPQVAIDGGPHTSGSTQIPASTWQHLAATYDGSTIRLYQDGVETSSQAHAAPSSTSATYQVGAYQSSGFRSLIDDVRQYDRPLTQSEITHLATARGIEGRPFDGLGDEQLWLCPSLENSPNDISGNNNNGVYNGGMGTVTSDSKLAYDFDGVGDYIECSGPTGNTGSFSLSLWASRGNGQSVTTTMAAQYDTVNVDRYWLLQQKTTTSGVVLRTYPVPTASTGRVDSETTSIAGNGVWYHITALYDATAGEQRLYIDGVLADSDSSTGFQATTVGLSLGLDAAQNWLGKLDDIRTYDRVLTQSEISWLATERGVLGTPPEGLGDEQLWLCPSIQDSPNDLSGNNNNGVYQNGMGTVTDTAEGGSRAYDFDGVGDYISNSSLDLRNLPAMSWSAWVKDDKTSGASSFFSHGLNGQYSNDTYFFQSAGNNSLQVNQSGDGTGSATSPTSSTWNHLAVVFDGSGAANNNRLRYFVNGVEVALSYDYTVPATTGNPSSSSTRIGDYVSAPGFNLFFGRQDDIRAYDRALTQAEISWLATERGVLGTPPEGLGDETCWICPTLTQNSTTDITNSGMTITTTGSVAVTADTGAGGTYANFCQGNGTGTSPHEVIVDNFGNTYAEVTSISWWSRRTAGATVIEMGMDTDLWPSAASGRFIYENWNGADRCYMYDPSGGTNGFINETGSNATWKHHVMVREGVGGKKRLYINGVLDTEEYDDGGWETTAKDTYFGIGGGSSSDSELYMDDMRTYGRALTQAEISWLATERGVLGTPPEGLGDEQLWLCPSIQDGANDLSGNNNNGVYQNGMGTITDTSNGGSLAYDFDGAGDYIDVTGYANSKTAYSLSTWINGTGPNQTVVAFNVGDSSGSRSLNLGLQPSATALVGHQASPSYYWAESTSTVNGAGWKHVAATYDGSDVKIYVDGVLEDTQAAPNSTTAQTRAFIGRWVGSTPFWLTGKMDDIRAYDRALTQAEITHLATSRGVLGPAPEGLGDELIWISPTLSGSGPASDITGGTTVTEQGTVSNIQDTGSGGDRALSVSSTGDQFYFDWPYITAGNIETFSFWIKKSVLNLQYGYWKVVNGNDSADAGNWTINDYGTAFGFFGITNETLPSQIPANQWSNVIITRDDTASGQQTTIYVDNVQVFQGNTSIGNRYRSQITRIGITSEITTTAEVRFDDVRIFDRIITASERSHLASQRGVLGSPTATTQYNAFLTHAFRQLFQTRIR